MRDSMITTQADVYTEEIPGGTRNSDSVMMPDSGATLQTSIPLVDYDMPDEARPSSNKFNSNVNDNHDDGDDDDDDDDHTADVHLDDVDAETIRFDNSNKPVAIARSLLPVPESQPKIGRNGISECERTKPKPVSNLDDDSCVVDCIYLTQQCCECVIL